MLLKKLKICKMNDLIKNYFQEQISVTLNVHTQSEINYISTWVDGVEIQIEDKNSDIIIFDKESRVIMIRTHLEALSAYHEGRLISDDVVIEFLKESGFIESFKSQLWTKIDDVFDNSAVDVNSHDY